MGIYAEFLEAGRAAALEAGDLLRRDFHRLGEVRFKSEINLVTASDHASQDLIFERLSSRYRDHDFLAEEGLKELSGAAFRWVFDPLDGTTNFAHRFPVFCVSIGLECEGRIVCGIVHNPMSGETFWAEAGEGAWLDGRRIQVSATGDLGKSLVATGFSYDIRESRANIAEHERVLLRAQGVRRCGSAALDLCGVACGRFDGFWELRLNPWDTAAGAVIVPEAGGRISDFEGRPVDIYRPEVVASNGLVHDALLEVLNEK
jgi:myo-inositol-1(or 4)-monophosphatase